MNVLKYYQEYQINIRANSILLFEGNPYGLEFLLATDGITSKGSLGLDYSLLN